jgi:uncharacterized peroxidase-related enzyme
MIQRFISLRAGAVPDVILACQHRPEFFGRAFLAWVDTAVRGRSHWTQAERELIAAVVSDRNRCQFCVASHSATAATLLGDSVVERVVRGDLGDPQLPITAQLRATMLFIEKLTTSPADVGSADIERVLASGVSEDALRDAIEVCAAFNTINRVADALDFEVQSPRSLAFTAKLMTTRGYRA